MAKFTKFDISMFKKAQAIAETSNFDHFRIGCVIAYKHHVISSASNSYKTHPLQQKYNTKYRPFNMVGRKPCVHSVHAEMAALSLIPLTLRNSISWKDVSVYVYRISPGKSSGHGLARPCPACMAALKQMGIRNIYYSGEDSFVYERIGWDA